MKTSEGVKVYKYFTHIGDWQFALIEKKKGSNFQVGESNRAQFRCRMLSLASSHKVKALVDSYHIKTEITD
jgi:hypothetical protein